MVIPNIGESNQDSQKTGEEIKMRTEKNIKARDITISAGNQDNLYIFSEGKKSEKIYYVLSENTRLGYIGLEAFRKENGKLEQIGDIFLQDMWNVEECLGKNWEKKSPMWKTKMLVNYLPY